MPFFPYARDRRWAPLFALLSIKDTDGVEVSEGMLRATFGRVSVETPTDNVDHTLVTGPHHWFTAVGLRLSFTDDSLTFGTNHHLGLWITFVERVPKVIGVRDHSSLWVSVADPDGLAAALER
ncbi:MAG: hypothetical protein OEV20_00800 [Actinomycetota bacterium]|nr:hypothetical protein [Actinomycetota bacterium]